MIGTRSAYAEPGEELQCNDQVSKQGGVRARAEVTKRDTGGRLCEGFHPGNDFCKRKRTDRSVRDNEVDPERKAGTRLRAAQQDLARVQAELANLQASTQTLRQEHSLAQAELTELRTILTYEQQRAAALEQTCTTAQRDKFRAEAAILQTRCDSHEAKLKAKHQESLHSQQQYQQAGPGIVIASVRPQSTRILCTLPVDRVAAAFIEAIDPVREGSRCGHAQRSSRDPRLAAQA
ncbi:hypothetical protein WJX73_006889 [Symbiochloris irregularis]|uniref:Uncharacterized protein n=1 Tax=Symbiochloris irregularis TaxID=706552 RepID=A0AAW1P3A9_9CHLO